MREPNPDIQEIRMQQTRGFFMQVPALIDWLGLEPISRVLYEHYLRVCGDHEWSEYTKTTAKFCEVSERSVRTHRKKLADLGLINMRVVGDIGDQRVVISINDIWPLNALFLTQTPMLKAPNIETARLWLREQLSKTNQEPHPPTQTRPESQIATPEPLTTTTEPHAITSEPQALTLEPQIVTPEPLTTVPEPQLTVPEPHAGTSKPQAVMPELLTTVPELHAVAPEPSHASKLQAMRLLASAIIDMIGGWIAKEKTLSRLTWSLITWLWLWRIIHGSQSPNSRYDPEHFYESERIARKYPNIFGNIENIPAILLNRAANAAAPLTQEDEEELKIYLFNLATEIETEKENQYEEQTNN